MIATLASIGFASLVYGYYLATGAITFKHRIVAKYIFGITVGMCATSLIASAALTILALMA